MIDAVLPAGATEETPTSRFDQTRSIRACRCYSIVIDPLVLSSEPVVEGSLRTV